MTSRIHAHLLTPLVLAAALIGTPAALAATAPGSGNGTGGAGFGAPASAPSPTPSGAPAENPLVTPADTTISATGDGITVETSESGLLRRQYRFTGTVPAVDAGEVVQIERDTGATSSATPAVWTPTAQATVGSSGAFTVSWRASESGRFAIEAVLTSPSEAAAFARSGPAPASTGTGAASVAAPDGLASPALEITVYRPSVATFYGPGFYGDQTACGETLHRATLGVASRTLKCGTKVSLMYRGRAIVVPVIDRGPYANGANWDLTQATAKALGITSTVTIGALPTS